MDSRTRTHPRDGLRKSTLARDTNSAFSGAELIIVPQGEHWFHTPEQLAVMADWERKHK